MLHLGLLLSSISDNFRNVDLMFIILHMNDFVKLASWCPNHATFQLCQCDLDILLEINTQTGEFVNVYSCALC